jgi:hypothetical protein
MAQAPRPTDDHTSLRPLWAGLAARGGAGACRYPLPPPSAVWPQRALCLEFPPVCDVFCAGHGIEGSDGTGAASDAILRELRDAQLSGGEGEGEAAVTAAILEQAAAGRGWRGLPPSAPPVAGGGGVPPPPPPPPLPGARSFACPLMLAPVGGGGGAAAAGGRVVGHAEAQGPRPSMEDSASVRTRARRAGCGCPPGWGAWSSVGRGRVCHVS